MSQRKVCGICGAEELNGNISIKPDRDRNILISDKNLHYTHCCNYAISHGRKGCLNMSAELVEVPLYSA